MTHLILLFLAHYLGDYTHLSTKWMLDAKRTGSPFEPIMAHACVHGVLFMIVSVFFCPEKAFIIGAFQILTHFSIDVWKGKMNVWFPSLSDPACKYHWYIFGFDQLLHHIVIITIYFYSDNSMPIIP